jgi:hypothetical protein
MPIRYGEFEIFLHGLSGYDPVLVVPFEGKGIVRFRTLIGDLSDSGKILFVTECD